MAHHSSRPSPELEKLFRDHREAASLGPTGRFPEGKLTNEDEGEIRVGITHMDGKVVMDFGSKVTWIGFTADQAIEIATTLQLHAAALRAAAAAEVDHA